MASAILVSFGFLSAWLVSHRRVAGWWLGLLCQPLWFTYGLLTRQPGFLLSAVVYGAISASAVIRWRSMAERILNPGDAEAIDQGCTCPYLYNHRGQGFPWDGKQSFWITEGCPLHDPGSTLQSTVEGEEGSCLR